MATLIRFIGLYLLIFFSSSHAENVKMSSTVEATGYSGYIETQGTVYPRRQVIYRFRSGDRVFNVAVSEGQTVKKGENLFSLTNEQLIGRLVDIRDRINAVNTAQNEILRLKIRLEQKRSRLKHLKYRLKNEKKVAEVVSGLTSTSNLDLLQEQIIEAEDELTLLENQYDFASDKANDPAILLPDLNKNLENLQRQYARLSPTAPFDGVVHRVIENSDPSLPGNIVMELWDASGYRIEGLLTQNQLPYVKPGAKAEIFTDYYSEQKLAGKVIKVMPVASTTGKNDFPVFPVVVELNELSDTIFPGMKVSLKIIGN